jgi:hypothetical protein
MAIEVSLTFVKSLFARQLASKHCLRKVGRLEETGLTQESRCQGARATDVVPDYSTAVGIRLEFLPKLKLPPLTFFAFLVETDLAGRLLTFLAGFFPFFATMILSSFTGSGPSDAFAPASRASSPLGDFSRCDQVTESGSRSHARLSLNDDFHSAILGASGGRRVVGDWLRCSVAVDLDAVRRDAAGDEHCFDRFSAELG